MKKLPKSIRKYIRKEKARIRREILDFKEQKRLIEELYKQFVPSQQTKEERKRRKSALSAGQAPGKLL